MGEQSPTKFTGESLSRWGATIIEIWLGLKISEGFWFRLTFDIGLICIVTWWTLISSRKIWVKVLVPSLTAITIYFMDASALAKLRGSFIFETKKQESGDIRKTTTENAQTPRLNDKAVITQTIKNSPGSMTAGRDINVNGTTQSEIEKALEKLASKKAWKDNGGDSVPHLVPHFDQDNTTRLFVKNDSSYSMHINYDEVWGTIYFVGGSSATFKYPKDSKEGSLEVLKRKRRHPAF
ncbi:MAG: hypothetical protein WCU88_13820 [Elusimicrobiota bacterium]|jgi:hypothetical protein